MATLKLKTPAAKKSANTTDRERKAPVRGGASGARKKRPTLAEAQAERAEREAQFQQRQRPDERNDAPKRPPRRDTGGAGGNDWQAERRGPRNDRPPRPDAPRRGPRNAPADEGFAREHPPASRTGSGPAPRAARPTGPNTAFGKGNNAAFDRPPRERAPDEPGAFRRKPEPPAERGFDRPRDAAKRRPPGDDNRPPRGPRPGEAPPPRHGKPSRDATGSNFDRPRRGTGAFDAPAPRGPARPPLPPARPVSPKARPAPRGHRDDDDDDDFPVHVDAPGSMRLSKRISELGLASRREADDWIVKGWVRVDGKLVKELGSRVTPEQLVTIDAKAYQAQSMLVTVLLHKPIGYVSGQAEDGYEPASVLVTRQNQWRQDRSGIQFLPHHLRKLAPAGRLDIDSTGLLVLTQDGRVAKQLIGEDSEVEKEYLVRVESTSGRRLSDEDLALLNHGLELDGEPLRPAQVEWLNDDQLRFVLREGKKRQIRRMCEAVGLKVVGLKRVRIGHVMLGDLPPGQWRYLRGDERFA
jgi:23S rRNA pseudouridine2604 synthase